MSISKKLKYKEFCDGCDKLKTLNTIGGHKRCEIYKITMVEKHDAFLASKGNGYFPRPPTCQATDKDE